MAYEPLKDIKAESERQADAFKANLPSIKQGLYDVAGNQSRLNLADQMDQIRRQSSKRGLLYGGINQGLQQQAQAGESANLMQNQYNINKQLEDQQNQLEQGTLNNALEKYRGDVSAYEKQFGIDTQRAQNQRGLMGGIAGNVLGAAIPLAFSDENVKENISDGSSAAQELLDNIKPEKYDYKDSKMGEGKHLSPMAQDLEKSEIGKSAVVNTPQGKMVNYGKLSGAMLAIQAALNQRLKKLEARS